MNSRGLKRVGLVVAVCALAGAIAGIAGSMAAPSKSARSKARAAHAMRMRWAHGARHLGMGLGIEPGGPPVHAEAVVPNAAGDGFQTITTDAGKLKAIDGSKLTVTEGTDKATYAEPTIDVGSSPTVYRNHEKVSLSDLKEGDFVRIVQGPKGTLVWAEDPDFRAKEQSERDHWGPHPGPGFGPPPGAHMYPG
jgi:hypothetical protein